VTGFFDDIVARLERHAGVHGVMLVGIDDGMVIAGDAGPGRDSDTAAALASLVYRRTRTAADEAGLGDARFVRLEAEFGQMCATAHDDVLVVAMTSNQINLGKLRLDMMGATEML
jgi:predicted regulator of Ras-like GTPase activity (Roadblock/LC7/MglB family)